MNLPRLLASRKKSRRRGATVVIVLGLLAMTLAVSYAMMRTQVTSLQIQNNFNRRGDARQAALTGLSLALRHIHTAEWAATGVATPLKGTLGDGERYEVKFTTGDDALDLNDPLQREEYPYRLTITATGFAQDPSNANRETRHEVQAVVQLVRRAFSTPLWTNPQDYTLYQWDDATTEIQFPARVEGKVRLGGKLDLDRDYPGHNDVLERYFKDLKRMRDDGWGDHRPFNQPVELPSSGNSSAAWQLADLGLPPQYVDAGGTAPFSFPDPPETYRLYPGGEEYEVPEIPSELPSVTPLQTDVKKNPLRVFRASSGLAIKSRTDFEGAVFTTDLTPNIEVRGQEGDDPPAMWRAPKLPPLDGPASGETVCLPAALVKGDFRVLSDANARVEGAMAVWGEFEVVEGSAQTTFRFKGHLLAEQVAIRGRSSWDQTDWSGELAGLEFFEFVFNIDPKWHFPYWLQLRPAQLNMAPKITLRPSDNAVKYHWQDWSQPVYVPAAGDAGLIWDVVRWNELPPE
jgi:hypothetical protein